MSVPSPPSPPKTTVTTPSSTGSASSGTSLTTPAAPSPSAVLTTPSTAPKPAPSEPEAKDEEKQKPVKPEMQKENPMEDPVNKWLLLLFKMLFGRGGALLGALGALTYLPGKMIEKATGRSGLVNFSRSLSGGNKTTELAEQVKQYKGDKEAYKKTEDKKIATDAKKETDQAMQLGTAEKKLADQQKNNTGGSPLQAPDYANTLGKALPIAPPAPTSSNAPTPPRPSNP